MRAVGGCSPWTFGQVHIFEWVPWDYVRLDACLIGSASLWTSPPPCYLHTSKHWHGERRTWRSLAAADKLGRGVPAPWQAR